MLRPNAADPLPHPGMRFANDVLELVGLQAGVCWIWSIVKVLMFYLGTASAMEVFRQLRR